VTRTVVLRVAALAILLLLVLFSVLILRTTSNLPDALVYFVNSQPTYFELQPALRQIPASDDEELVELLFEELRSGPTEAEQDAGLATLIPAGTQLLNASVDDGIATVDLSEEFEQGGGSSQMQGRLFQLFYTLTQPNGIDGVSLLIQGQPVRSFSGEGILVEQPWLREEQPVDPIW